MRKVVLSIFLAMPFISYGQLLWSTKAEDVNKRVTLEQGIERMMDNYDLYEYYSANMGYTHEQWVDDIDDNELRQEWEERFAEFTDYDGVLYAYRSRIENDFGGTTLVVMVTYIDSEYIHRVVFTNSSASEPTYSSGRRKFERWFRTFIEVDVGYRGDKTGAVGDQGDKTGAVGDQGDKTGNADTRAMAPKVLYPGKKAGGGSSLEMTGWIWDAMPDPIDNTSESGKIVFEVIINDRGNVTSAKPISYTVSKSLMKLYQAEVEHLTFSKTSSDPAPATTKGVIAFIIKIK